MPKCENNGLTHKFWDTGTFSATRIGVWEPNHSLVCMMEAFLWFRRFLPSSQVGPLGLCFVYIPMLCTGTDIETQKINF